MPKASWVFNSSPNSSKATTFKTFDSSIYQPYIHIKFKKEKKNVLPNLAASSKLKEQIMGRVLFIKSSCLTPIPHTKPLLHSYYIKNFTLKLSFQKNKTYI